MLRTFVRCWESINDTGTDNLWSSIGLSWGAQTHICLQWGAVHTPRLVAVLSLKSFRGIMNFRYRLEEFTSRSKLPTDISKLKNHSCVLTRLSARMCFIRNIEFGWLVGLRHWDATGRPNQHRRVQNNPLPLVPLGNRGLVRTSGCSSSGTDLSTVQSKLAILAWWLRLRSLSTGDVRALKCKRVLVHNNAHKKFNLWMDCS